MPLPSTSKGPVLVLPGYLRDCSEYAPLVAHLRARGYDAWAAPIRWYHWTPTVGGRSMRPILDRIHFAVKHLALADTNALQAYQSGTHG